MAFDRQFLDELIARNDIVDVVSNYVSLQPRGGSLWGCCPFHSEKTPSFHVLPDKQLCYCFGCKKGGGGINFIVDTAKVVNHAFTWVPTPATVAPVEYTMTKEDYAMIGGHMNCIKNVEDFPEYQKH